jgi:CBS domain-containing protein
MNIAAVVDAKGWLLDAIEPDASGPMHPSRPTNSSMTRSGMNVRDLMRRWFERVEPTTSLLEAARLMVLTGQQALPVVDGEELVGMIAERDVLARLLSELSADVYLGVGNVDRDAAGTYRNICKLPVEELMSRRLVTTTPEMPALQAVALMRARRIQRLPVVEAGRLVGLVFQMDVHAALLGLSVHSR